MDYRAVLLGCCIGTLLGEFFWKPLLDKFSNWCEWKSMERRFKKDIQHEQE